MSGDRAFTDNTEAKRYELAEDMQALERLLEYL